MCRKTARTVCHSRKIPVTYERGRRRHTDAEEGSSNKSSRAHTTYGLFSCSVFVITIFSHVSCTAQFTIVNLSMPVQQRRRRLLFVTRESVYMSNATPEHAFCNFRLSRVFFRLSLCRSIENLYVYPDGFKKTHISPALRKTLNPYNILDSKDSVWYDSRYHSMQLFFTYIKRI